MKAVTERDKVQCPYQQLQQSSIFRIQLCVNTLSKLVAFAEHFPTIRNLSWLFVDQSSTGFSRSSRIARRLSASPVTCRPSLLSHAACLEAAFWDPSSFFYILLIALRCGLNVHSYADNTHLYVHCDAVNCAAEAARLAACIEEL